MTTITLTKSNIDNNGNFFLYLGDEQNYQYYNMIEDEQYFQPTHTYKNRNGKFNIHGKYVSTTHPGKKTPNEYYCSPHQAMTLRSGKKINYIQQNFIFWDLKELIDTWNKQPVARCLTLKKIIWVCQNYHHIFSNAFIYVATYTMLYKKLNEFIKYISNSPPPIYKKRNFKINNLHINVDLHEPLNQRIQNNYVFCQCNYLVVKQNKQIIEQHGYHQDKLLQKLKHLIHIYSTPHRAIKNNTIYKFIAKQTNHDCANIIFSFIPPISYNKLF